ncbi:MAG: ABC transporter ATP-binding protein [Nitrososphaerota archaeon]|nr:ABC transporter ATP-binding protein [Candidatus Bathyarchaeota archaeon]MDW8024168.1 ABC transporter ATP-binding protein [Nitrososphaerota archaeon]
MAKLLVGEKITVQFGGLVALNEVDFHIEKGEITGLIGPNGAGKTTLFNVISGIIPPKKGRVFFDGKNTTGLKPHKICKLGIARTFQIVRVFPSMTVFENVKAAALNSPKQIKESISNDVKKLLDFIGLSEKTFSPVKDLTLVEQKFVEVARALATKPKLLLLDEPLAGLNPTESILYSDKIRKLRDEFEITIFWIEHDVKSISSICDRVIVLDHGEKICEGKCEDVLKSEAVIKAYLGEEIA